MGYVKCSKLCMNSLFSSTIYVEYMLTARCANVQSLKSSQPFKLAQNVQQKQKMITLMFSSNVNNLILIKIKLTLRQKLVIYLMIECN